MSVKTLACECFNGTIQIVFEFVKRGSGTEGSQRRAEEEAAKVKERIIKPRFECRQAPGRGASIAGNEQARGQLISSVQSSDTATHNHSDFEGTALAVEIASLSDQEIGTLRQFFLLLDRYDRQDAANLQRAA